MAKKDLHHLRYAFINLKNGWSHMYHGTMELYRISAGYRLFVKQSRVSKSVMAADNPGDHDVTLYTPIAITKGNYFRWKRYMKEDE